LQLRLRLLLRLRLRLRLRLCQTLLRSQRQHGQIPLA
jgi:hypothetical protein